MIPALSHNPLDIDSTSFDAEMYTQKLMKEASLSQLMAQEKEIVKQIGSLDSDMQTLVYENYNKVPLILFQIPKFFKIVLAL